MLYHRVRNKHIYIYNVGRYIGITCTSVHVFRLIDLCVTVSIRASITFAAGQSSEIGRYEVPREESLPGLGIGMTIDDFQIDGIRHDVTESLMIAVRYSIALGPRFFR